jgi:hypothetical protein
MNQQEVNSAAHDISSWLQDAVGDVAYGCETWDDVEFNFGDLHGWKKKIKEAKAWPVTDIRGWLADELYNEKDTIKDLIGDRIFDAARGSDEDKILVAKEIVELGAHDALQRACEELIKDWRRRIRERKKREVGHGKVV